MKRLKRIMALVIAMAMVLTMMSVTAFATGAGTGEGGGEGSGEGTGTGTPTTHTITVPSTDTHTYKVYQILTGTLSDDKTTLSDAQWGSSTTPTNGKVAEKTVAEFAALMTTKSGNEAVTEAMKYVDLEKPLTGTVTKDTPMSGLAEGYYILVDVTDPLTNKDESGNVISTDTKALSLLQLLDDVTVTKKWGTSEDQKTIETDTLGQTGTATNTINDDDDNVSIGDTVNYKIEATVPENTDRYAPGTFFFVITDKLSEGLTINDDIKVYIQGAGENDADLELAAADYTLLKNPDCVYDADNTFEVALKDAANAKYRGKTIVVKYSAVVNEKAVIGDAGNANESKVKFSNNPDKDYAGTPDSNGDGFPDTITDVPTGETPTTETKTYVTGIEIQKVDPNGEPLTGAKFQIEGNSAKKVVTKTETFEEDAENGTYYKLKDNTYTMTPPSDKNEMVAAQPGATKGYVVDAEATGDGVIEIDDTKYRPVREGETATHVLKVGSADAYESPLKKYKKTVSTKTVDADATDKKMEEAVDANGLVRFDGLGAGTYTITETETPDGYNTISPIPLTVSYSDPDASGAPTARFTVSGGDAVYEDGIIKIKIVNLKGDTLPETGGIGTTIFYVIGTVLVLGAGVVLITRRRMDA